MRFVRYITAVLPVLYRPFSTETGKSSAPKLVNEFTDVTRKLQDIVKTTQLYKVERIEDASEVGKSIPYEEVIQVRPRPKKNYKK